MHGESKHKRQLFKSYLNIFCFLVDVCCFIMFHHFESIWLTQSGSVEAVEAVEALINGSSRTEPEVSVRSTA
jgi:hypothetical protein